MPACTNSLLLIILSGARALTPTYRRSKLDVVIVQGSVHLAPEVRQGCARHEKSIFMISDLTRSLVEGQGAERRREIGLRLERGSNAAEIELEECK